MSCPHSAIGDPARCSQCLGAPARRVEQQGNTVTVGDVSRPLNAEVPSAYAKRGAPPRKRDCCDDCGGVADLPMLEPEIWGRIAPGVIRDRPLHRRKCDSSCQCGQLCIKCAEKRLKRALRADDILEAST